MRRILEFLKNILIVLLIGSLLLLAVAAVPTKHIRSIPWLSTLLQPAAPLLGLPQSELTYVKAALPVMDAAQPIAISVRNSIGRSSAQWDFQALDDAFESLGGTLGQAFDTAAEFQPATQTQLKNALSGPSIYFSYGVTLPASLLASWLDASAAEDAPDANACVLSLEDDVVRLYLIGDETYAAATSIQTATLSRLLEQYYPDGSQFAFEAGYSQTPLSLLSDSAPALPGAVLSSPCDSRFIEQIASNLGFNPYGDTSYTDAFGSTYFTEANCALQVSEDGSLLLTSTATDRFHATDVTPEALVEEARRLVELASGDALGDARLYLSGLTRDGTVTQCTFDYLFSGIPVQLSSGSAVTVSFQENSVSQMTMTIVSFQQTSTQLHLMPAAQASAIVPAGQPLQPRYHAVNDALTAGWVLEQ